MKSFFEVREATSKKWLPDDHPDKPDWLKNYEKHRAKQDAEKAKQRKANQWDSKKAKIIIPKDAPKDVVVIAKKMFNDWKHSGVYNTVARKLDPELKKKGWYLRDTGKFTTTLTPLPKGR